MWITNVQWRYLLHRLNHIDESLKILTRMELMEMADLNTLKDDVANQSTVVDSAVTLLKGLKDALDAAIASGDPAAIQAVSDALHANTDSLAAAVEANTPAEPPATSV